MLFVAQSLFIAPFAAISTWLLAILGFMIAIPIVFVLGVWFFPIHFVWGFFWLYFKLFYRVKAHGLENLPKTGGVLLAPNHVSWLDGFLVQLLTPRHVCTLVYAGNFEPGWIKRMGETWKAILISANPKSIIHALRKAERTCRMAKLFASFPRAESLGMANCNRSKLA